MIPFGRIPSESLAGCHHNPWPDAVRMVGRMSSESLAECQQNMQLPNLSAIYITTRANGNHADE